MSLAAFEPVWAVGDGAVTAGQLRPGQQVWGPDGSVSEVRTAQSRGQRNCYAVQYEDGDEVVVDEHHTWKLWRTADPHHKPIVMPTWQLAGLSNLAGRLGTRLSRGIPGALYEPEETPPLANLDPYLMGILLFGGQFNVPPGTKMLRTFNKDLIPYLTAKGFLDTGKAVIGGTTVYTFRHTTIHHQLDKLGLQGLSTDAVYLPDLYRLSALCDRLEVVQGMADAAGMAGDSGTWTLASLRLCEDMRWLVASLGGSARTSGRTVSSYRMYDVEVRMHGRQNLSRLRPVSPSDEATTCDWPVKPIRAVQAVGTRESVSIQIGSPVQEVITRSFVPSSCA